MVRDEDQKEGGVAINRLRTGYTNFFHGYLMRKDERDVTPVCAKCHNAVLSVKHVLVESGRDTRIILGADLRRRTLLNANRDEHLIKFLKEVNIFKYI